MPHITLEYTDNIANPGDIRLLLKQINARVHEVSGADMSSCKSSARKLDYYCVGDQDSGQGFIRVDLLLLEGREVQRKQATGQAVLSLLESHFAEAIRQLQIQITVNVHDIEKATYMKFA